MVGGCKKRPTRACGHTERYKEPGSPTLLNRVNADLYFYFCRQTSWMVSKILDPLSLTVGTRLLSRVLVSRLECSTSGQTLS